MNNAVSETTVSPYVNHRWPEARWDVSGAFVNDRELIAFHDFCVMALGIKPFQLVHGAPLFIWNSGRVLNEFYRTAEEIRTAGLAYHERNIGVDLTFTNVLLTEKHVNDALGNALIEFFREHNSTGMNGVIVASDALYEHVKKNYPALKLVSSILKVSCEHGAGKLDYYLKLAEKYDKVMLAPDDVRNWKLLEKLEDKDKYELIINEYCIRKCPIRHRHYNYLSNMALDFLGYDGREMEKKLSNNGCQSMETLLTDPKHCVVAMTHEEITRAYEMGFRNFKMQGRGGANAGLILFDLLRLVLDEDKVDENAFHYLKLQFLERILPVSDY